MVNITITLTKEQALDLKWFIEDSLDLSDREPLGCETAKKIKEDLNQLV